MCAHHILTLSLFPQRWCFLLAQVLQTWGGWAAGLSVMEYHRAGLQKPVWSCVQPVRPLCFHHLLKHAPGTVDSTAQSCHTRPPGGQGLQALGRSGQELPTGGGGLTSAGGAGLHVCQSYLPSLFPTDGQDPAVQAPRVLQSLTFNPSPISLLQAPFFPFLSPSHSAPHPSLPPLILFFRV